MKFWITADTHFGHEYILEFAERPFSSVREMDNCIIDNWNDRIAEDDHVIHLGDFSFRPEIYLPKLNGHIHLVRGNHDKGHAEDLFASVRDCWNWAHKVPNKGAKATTYRAFMFHYPCISWNGSFHGRVHFHGHVHNKKRRQGENRFDVGVDANGFAPFDLIKFMSENGYEDKTIR